MRKAMTWLVPAVLAVMGLGCSKVYLAAPYKKAAHLTVLVYPAPDVPGGCASVTSPQYVYLRHNDDVIWDIKNETCKGTPDVTLRIEPSVVEISSDSTKKEKKGKVKGSPGKYSYQTVLSSGFVEDPQIEIW